MFFETPTAAPLFSSASVFSTEKNTASATGTSAKQILEDVTRHVAHASHGVLSLMVDQDGTVALAPGALRRLLHVFFSELLQHEGAGFDVHATAMHGAFVVVVKGRTRCAAGMPKVSSFFGNQTRFLQDDQRPFQNKKAVFEQAVDGGLFSQAPPPLPSFRDRKAPADHQLCPDTCAMLAQVGGYLRVVPGSTLGIRMMLPLAP